MYTRLLKKRAKNADNTITYGFIENPYLEQLLYLMPNTLTIYSKVDLQYFRWCTTILHFERNPAIKLMNKTYNYRHTNQIIAFFSYFSLEEGECHDWRA